MLLPKMLCARFILAAILFLTALGYSRPFAEAADSVARSNIGSSQSRGSSFRDCTECPVMLVIASGKFEMGSSDDEESREKTTDVQRKFAAPRHLVTIQRNFAMGQHDVTRAEFSIFVQETAYQPAKDCTGYSSGRKFGEGPRDLDWRNPGFPQTDRDPVVCVNWDDVQAYLTWLSRKTHKNYRVPTEAEWEYSARGGTVTARYWGDGVDEACRYANVSDVSYWEMMKIQPRPGNNFNCSDGHAYTAPAGSFLPNPFGLYDMLGNVQQYTADCWHYNYVGAPSDGSVWSDGDCALRVARGGSFNEIPRFIRSANRSNHPAVIRDDKVGFRVARDL